MRARFSAKWIGLFLLLMAMLVVTPAVYAIQIHEGDEITIGPDEVIPDDMIVFCETFVLDGKVQGDLIVFAANVTINGVVEGDMWAAGRWIVINGEVQDDMLVGAAAIEVREKAHLYDELFGGGYSLDVRPGSVVDGSLFFGGFQAQVAGELGENLYAGVNNLALNGPVAKDAYLSIGSKESAPPFDIASTIPEMPAVPNVASGLTIGEAGSIGGDLHYTAAKPLEAFAPIVKGQVIYTPEPQSTGTTGKTIDPAVVAAHARQTWMMNNVRHLLTLLVIAALLAWQLPSWLATFNETLQGQPLPSFGWGLLGFILIPILLPLVVGVTLLLSIFLGILQLGPLGGILFWVTMALASLIGTIYFVALPYLFQAFLGYVVGRAVLKQVKPELNEKPFWPALLGALLIAILLAIPLLGWLAGLLITVMGLGGLWLYLRPRFTTSAV